MLGAVAVATRGAVDRHVVGDFLPGRRTRQQAHQRCEVFQRRHDLLDAGDDDMHFRQRCHHAAVALVGDERHRAGLRDQEVAAGDAHVGAEEVLAQASWPRASAPESRSCAVCRAFFGEEIGDLVEVLVRSRREDVRGGSLPESCRMMYSPRSVSTGWTPAAVQRDVELRLLGEHRLRLDDFFAPCAARWRRPALQIRARPSPTARWRHAASPFPRTVRARRRGCRARGHGSPGRHRATHRNPFVRSLRRARMPTNLSRRPVKFPLRLRVGQRLTGTALEVRPGAHCPSGPSARLALKDAST